MPDQPRDIAVTIFGQAMQDLTQPREEFEEVVAREKYEMHWQTALSADPDHTSPFGRPAIRPRGDIQADQRLGNGQARYLIVGYARPKARLFANIFIRSQKPNLGLPRPHAAVLPWYEPGQPIVYVVAEILQQTTTTPQTMPTLYALMLPYDGVYTPYRLEPDHVYFRYEYRKTVEYDYQLSSVWGSTIFEKCAQLSGENIPVMSSEVHDTMVQCNRANHQAPLESENITSEQNDTVVKIEEDDDDDIQPNRNDDGHAAVIPIHQTAGLKGQVDQGNNNNNKNNSENRENRHGKKRALTKRASATKPGDPAPKTLTLTQTLLAPPSPTEGPTKRLRTPNNNAPSVAEITPAAAPALSADAREVTRRAREVLLKEIRTRNSQKFTYVDSALRATVAALQSLLDEEA